MPTPDELRARIAAGRASLRSAIAAVAGRWDAAPAGEWSPRQIAEHAIPMEVAFASDVCAACGYPGLPPWEASYPSAADALANLDEAGAKADGRLKYVSDNDLTMKQADYGDVAGLMAHNADHLEEHAAQMRGA